MPHSLSRPLQAKKKIAGVSLIEVLIGAAVFLVIALSVYQVYAKILEVVRLSRLKITASAVANEQFELIRNLSYADVGLIGGIPPGKIPPLQTITRDNIPFEVKTTIRNIDDPFDGTIGGNPNDTSPADYKLVEIEISCTSCKNFTALSFTSFAAPKNLETATGNGALFIRAFDANGQPVPGANVHIENNQAVPATVIDDTTNNDGMLQIVDAPPGIEAYEISVTKSGYSTEKTFPPGGAENPNPVKPHATVVGGQLTQVSFAIDRLSTLDVESVTETCTPVGDVNFSLKGSKIIGTNPDVPKYEESHITSGAGSRTISNLEWDTYELALTDGIYDLVGSIPLLPITIAPGSTQNLKLVVAAKNPRSLVVTVKDAGTQLPLSGAMVKLEKTGFQQTLFTGQGFLRQTDWSGGSGQSDFTDPARYLESDGNVEDNNPAGEVRLRQIFGDYASEGSLTSSTFDTGSASNFYQILWQPQDQAPETGLDGIRFQIATNNDKTTWTFRGPDGTSNTFYTLADTNINSIHNGHRYLRYKAFLRTANTSFTPILAEVAFTFSSLCVPSGQVKFDALASGDYTLTVTKDGYQTFNDTITVSSSWQQKEVILTP